MASMLETIKKGMSALNPLGSKVDKSSEKKVKAPKPDKPKDYGVNPNDIKNKKKAIDDIMKDL